MNLPIPYPDPMPLPAPVWLLRTLLLLTFFLHILFMNTLLGGTAIALGCSLQRRSSKFAALLAADLGRMLPSVFAFTITLGVAPLLFLQVIYGHLLYTSSILMAVPWLGIIGLVLMLPPWIKSSSSEFAITNKRVLIKVGLIRRHSLELLLQKVEGIGVDQGFLGRVLGYGTITVSGVGGTKEAFRMISNPLEFRRQVQASLAS